MRKRFNDTGLCIPARHYMADTSAKLRAIMKLVEEGAYFTINRPRQYGKTTMAYLLSQHLADNDAYFLLEMSFEGIGDAVFESEERFCRSFAKKLSKEFKVLNQAEMVKFINQRAEKVQELDGLSELISEICEHTGRKIVLSIDEIDKSSNNQLFLSFLGMLREKYLQKSKGRESSFQSVILIGVHDVKTLKLKISPESKGKLNSPWNIAIDFRVDMSFSQQEIEYMLADYVQENEIEMDIVAIAEKIHYYTSGYPYLVSKISKFVDEDIITQRSDKNWSAEDIEAAFKLMTYGGYTTTLFDSLTKNLENEPDLFEMIFDISINGASYDFNVNASVVNRALVYGIIRDKQGMCQIHNRVFEQRLYGYFLAKQETEKGATLGILRYKLYTDDGLSLPNILVKFQEFMKENYSHKDAKFLEREGRLLFLSFLKPIINGQGFEFKEPNVAVERRMDIVITFGKYRYVLELKRWEGEAYHQIGLQQLSDYLDTYSLKEGFLLIFDFRKSKEYKQEHIQFGDKEIFAVWV